MTKYKLIFNGQLLENADKASCIQGLSRVFKKDPEIIEKKLFSGKKIIVKTTTDRKVVDTYLRVFENVGARLLVKHEIMGKTPSQLSKDQRKSSLPVKKIVDKKADKGKTKSASLKKKNRPARLSFPIKKRRWAFSGFCVLFILIVLVGGYLFLNNKILKAPVPQIVYEVENALATEGLILFGHANIEKAVELESLFLDEPDKDALMFDGDSSFISKLVRNDINLREAVHQVLFSLHVKGSLVDAISPFYSFVLIGAFNPHQIRSFVEGEYETEMADFNNDVILFRKQDIDNCSFSPMRAIYIEDSRIIVTAPDKMAFILDRMNGKAEPEIDLADWRKYRGNMLASAGIFAPEHTDKATNNGLVAMFLSKLKDEIGPVKSGFAGVKPHLFPPGVKFDVALLSDDQNWIHAKTNKLRKFFADSQKNLSVHLKLASDLYDHLSVLEEPGIFRTQFIVNRKLFENLGDLFGEVMGSLFPMTQPPSAQTADIKEERLESSPAKFFDQLDFSSLGDFRDFKDPFFKPDWTEGPFGIYIESLTLNKENEIEIFIKSEGREIKNIGNSEKRAYITITSVKKSNGEELLKEETCGKERNSLPAFFKGQMPGSFFKDNNIVYYKKINGEKKIRLKPYTEIKDIASLEGMITLDLPVKTSRILLRSPFESQIVQEDNVRILFKKGAKNRLTYELSGNYNNVLAVRGLNKEKKVLSKTSGFSMGRFWGGGKSVDQEYQGEVAYAEIIMVKASRQKKYHFILPTIMPKQEISKYPHFTENIPPVSLLNFDQQVAGSVPVKITKQNTWLGKPDDDKTIGPFIWQLYGFQVNPYWGIRGTAKIYSPVIPSLVNNLSAVNVVIDEARLQDGGVRLLNYSEFITLERQGGYFQNGIYKPDPAQNYIAGQKEIHFPYKEDRPAELIGKVVLRLPLKISDIPVANLNLGAETMKNGYKITVTAVGRGSMDLAIQGNRNRVLSFHMFNSSGEAIKCTPSQIEKKNAFTSVQLRFEGIPKRLVMHLAKQIESREFPLSVKL